MIRREVYGPEAAHELGGAQSYRDVRSGFRGIRDALASSASGLVLGMAAVGIGFEPGIIDVAVPACLLYAGWVLTRKVVLPFRLPKGARRKDYNHPDPENRKPRMAAGIIYIGRDFRTGQQLWIANEDGRQHVVVPGTTGAGKTAALLSLVSNALMHGSGFIFVDGKADNKLFAEILALARKFGREDDVLALNFLVASGNKDTNTFNPFAWGNADVIRELLVSQIEAGPKGAASSGNEVFMARAVSLLGALTPALVWLRDNKGIPIDIERIRFATELGSIATLALEKRFLRLDVDTGTVESIDVSDIEPALLYPLSAYLGETGGYDKSLAYNKQKTDEPAKQHSFVTMHFSATFTQLAVSLGHIFKCESGDIDMRDVVLNRRILVVNLPTLENSGETTAALGKIMVASLRNMMAQTLGVSLEGDYDEIVANKPGMSPTPFPVVLDEIGYYAVSGMDKMLAMGRGLGFMFYLGFQELPGLKARIGESMYSLLGNATLQILMKLQEGSETRKYVEDTAGQIEVTQQTSYNATDGGGYRDAQHAEVRRVSRVDWKDLKGLIEGEAIVLFGNRRVYAKLFYAKLDVRGGRLRLNRPAVLRPPALDAIGRTAARTSSIRALIEGGGAQAAPGQVDTGPVLAAIVGGFRRERQAGKPLANCVQAAIMAADVPVPASFPPVPAPMLTAGPASRVIPDASGSDYDAMLESVGRLPMVETDAAPILPPAAVDLDLIGMLTAIEEHSGQFRAQARVRAMQVLAERDAALAGPISELPPMSPQALGRIIQTMILELSPPAVLAQAAE